MDQVSKSDSLNLRGSIVLGGILGLAWLLSKENIGRLKMVPVAPMIIIFKIISPMLYKFIQNDINPFAYIHSVLHC
jgi:hypothetical protein